MRSQKFIIKGNKNREKTVKEYEERKWSAEGKEQPDS